MAEANSPMRYGSSPNVSSTRPQRRSRAMHSTGEKVHLKPVLVASTAVIRAIRRAFSGFQLQATASCVPKIVAPGQQIRDAISGREAVVLVRMHHVPFDEIER